MLAQALAIDRTRAYDVEDHTIVSHACHSDHVPVTLLSRECLYGGIRRWILSLPLLFTLIMYSQLRIFFLLCKASTYQMAILLQFNSTTDNQVSHLEACTQLSRVSLTQQTITHINNRLNKLWTAVRPAVQLLQIQKVHTRPHLTYVYIPT